MQMRYGVTFSNFKKYNRSLIYWGFFAGGNSISTLSTVGGVQYRGGYHEYHGGYLEYRGGIS